jgi:superfamily I DNA/RNA helicase
LNNTTKEIPAIFKPDLDGYPNGSNKILLYGSPGTGKTYNILTYFVEPALKAGIDTKRILSCSFTRAAAKELRDRLSKKTGLPEFTLLETCSTIHAEALRRFRTQFGMNGYEIYGETIYDNFLEEGPSSRFEETSKKEQEDEQRAQAIKIWDLSRNKLIGDLKSEAFERLVKNLDTWANVERIRNYIREYEGIKSRTKTLDFTDIIIKALRCAPPERELLVVDEVQDCTPLQLLLLDKWINKAERVVLIGDGDQVLFEFSGVDPSSMIKLTEKGFTLRRLAKSFRVPKKIHKLARTIITKNVNRIDAPYEPLDKEGTVLELSRPSAAEEIFNASSEGKDVFVLARSANILGGWTDLLAEVGVPFINERGRSPWGSQIELSVAKAVAAVKENLEMTYEDANRLIEKLPGRDPRFFKKKVTKVSLKAKYSTKSGTLISSQLSDDGIVLEEIKNADYKDLFMLFKMEYRAAALANIIKRWGPEILHKTPNVTLTSQHACKGRERDLVVVDMGCPPFTAKAIALDKTGLVREAERRLCYVAFTRTKDTLIICRNSSKDLGGIVGLDDDKTFVRTSK